MKKVIKKFTPKLYSKLTEIKRYLIIKKFKKNYPDTKILEPETIKLYSQDNQDYIVYENFFKGKKDGFFCDIGGGTIL